MTLRLTHRLTLIFVFFAAALLMAVSLLAYNSGRKALEAAATAELESTAGEKKEALTAWVEEKKSDIQALADDPAVMEKVSALITSPLQIAPPDDARGRLIEEFEPRMLNHEFLVVMLLDPETGQVLAATDPSEEGKFRADRPYFLEGKKGAFLTPIYFSQELQTPAITVSAPVLSEEGRLLGVLAGRVNLDELDAIIQRRSGLHQTDDSFLVNPSYEFITQPRFLPEPAILQSGISTMPVKRCLQHRNGTVFATEYENMPVIAVYRWLPETQMCLIATISQAEALASEHSFAIRIGWIGLIALLVATLAAVAVSHTIIHPIVAMQAAAQHYGQGDLTVRLPERRQDELGLLAREFNLMAASLETKENQLRNHSLELEREVAERTAELYKSEMRFKTLIENAPDGIALLGLDGKLRQVTPSTIQILGYSLENAQEQNPGSLTHPDDLPALLDMLNDLFQNPNKVVRAQYRFRHKDGSWRWLESTLSNLISEPGVEAIVFNYRDISERKHAQEALSESEEKFKYIFDHSVVGKSITLIDGSLSVNKAFCDMLGYSEEELVNKKWQDITHSEDIALSSQMTEILLTGMKEAVRFTKRYIHKDGSTIWADVSISLRRDHEGKPLYFMTALLDITDRKQAEVQLADALEFTEHILTSSPFGILIYKFTGECVSANVYAAQLIGATLEEVKSQNFRQLESWRKSGLYELAEKAIMERGHTAADIYHMSTFGKKLWLRAQFVTFKSHGEELLLLTLSDITERKQAEETLRESEDRFRDIVEHIHDLIGTHDLEGNILSINPAAVELLGVDIDTLLKMNMRDILAPEVRDQFDDYLVTIQRAGQASGLMLVQTKKGERRFWQYDNTLRKDSSRGPIVRALARDITESKQAEEGLREKQRLLSEAQHIGRMGSLSYDIQNDAFQFSDEMYQLLDVLPEKFQHNGKSFMVVVYPSDRLQVASWIADLKAGWQIKELDFRIFRQNGELRYLHCKGAVEFNSKGESTRFIGTMQDVTERRLAEMQINQQIKRLTALSEIDHAIISGFDQQRTLEVILSHTISQLQVDAADILLMDSDGQMLSYAAGQGFRTQAIAGSHARLGESYAGRVAKERRLVRVADLREKSQPPHLARMIAEEGFITYIAVPLMVKGRVKGVLEVFHRALLQTYPEWLDFLTMLAGQTAIAVENANLVENMQQSNRDLTEAYDAAIEGWSHAMDLRDKETVGHSQRVTELTVKVARAMGIDEDQLIHIRRGALLHDIGKLAIPDHILFKPGKLTSEEWEIMQKHPEFAYEMLSPIRYLKPALPIPYFHHEKWDGTGYPLGLRGEQIPLEARVFAVTDVWDALLSDRPYRKAWTVERTLEYIGSLAGSHFDPEVVECFLAVIKTAS